MLPELDDLQELRIMLSQSMEKWAKDDLATGRIECREEGRIEGTLRTLSRQLSRRFGHGVPDATATRRLLMQTRWRLGSTVGNKKFPCHSCNSAKYCCGTAACVLTQINLVGEENLNRPNAAPVVRQFSLLVVHQSAELYGSDRCLIECLTGLDRREYSVIVCLPEHGPLEGVLRDAGFEVHILPLFKLARSRLTREGLLAMLGDRRRAIAGIEAAVGGRHIDLVYTNTLAVLAGALWARKRGIPHIWHVHEIIQRPALVASFFRWFVPRLSVRIVCNSIQTKAWLSDGDDAVAARTVTVWNGVETSSSIRAEGDKSAIKQGLKLSPRPLVLMVGRVNAWKGQDLLVDAVERVHARTAVDFDVLMLGSAPPGQDEFMVALQAKVSASAARSLFQIRQFVDDPAPYYRAADLLIVPSREPEPFGRVAIEGMAYGLPVIAANHGGLKEIVEDGVTGILFTPNDAKELADAIVRLTGSEQTRQAFSVAARERQQAFFSLDAYRAGMLSVLRDVLAQQRVR